MAYDFGIKHNILRRLASFGCKITVVPADYPASKVLEMNPDGVFLSNGPVSVSNLFKHLYNDTGPYSLLCLLIHAQAPIPHPASQAFASITSSKQMDALC